MFVTFAIASSQLGRITAIFDSRLYPPLGANLLLGCEYVVILYAPGLGIAAVGVLVTGVGFGILGSMYRSIITGFAPQTLRGGLTSLSEAGNRLTASLTPLAMGLGISISEPAVGLGTALRYTGLGAALVGGGGVICVLIEQSARRSPRYLYCKGSISEPSPLIGGSLHQVESIIVVSEARTKQVPETKPRY